MADPIFKLIENETRRQHDTLMMIPSENYASPAVRQAVGSVLMNKYAEGRVHKRYYQGNVFIDEIEALCEERALEVFGLQKETWGVCVQAHSGGVANFAALSGVVPFHEGKIMSMYLPDGGHLSHGWQMPNKKIHIASKLWNFEYYRIAEKTKMFDYDEIEKHAKSFLPHVMISGGTAYPREIDHKRMGQIAHSIGALYFADIAHEAGLVAAGVNTSPFPFADIVTMTTHKTLRGPRGALVYARKDKKLLSSDESVFSAIDFSIFPGLQGGPHMHSIGGIAVALSECLQPEFAQYGKQVLNNARVLSTELLALGFDVVSKGTDKHLILIDLRNMQLSGYVVAQALERAGIIVNRNTVPHETASPFFPSGIRLGTPALTTRGMKEPEMKKIASWIGEVVDCVRNQKLPEKKEDRAQFLKEFDLFLRNQKSVLAIADEVVKLCALFPTP